MLCYVTAVISCSVLVERTRSSEYTSNYSTERLKSKKKLIFVDEIEFGSRMWLLKSGTDVCHVQQLLCDEEFSQT